MTDQALQIPVQNLLKSDIFDLLGMAGISSKQRQDISTDMIVTIQNRIIARLSDSLSADEQDALIDALSEKKTVEAREILSRNDLSSLETMAVEEALIYKHQLVNE